MKYWNTVNDNSIRQYDSGVSFIMIEMYPRRPDKHIVLFQSSSFIRSKYVDTRILINGNNHCAGAY